MTLIFFLLKNFKEIILIGVFCYPHFYLSIYLVYFTDIILMLSNLNCFKIQLADHKCNVSLNLKNPLYTVNRLGFFDKKPRRIQGAIFPKKNDFYFAGSYCIHIYSICSVPVVNFGHKLYVIFLANKVH